MGMPSASSILAMYLLSSMSVMASSYAQLAVPVPRKERGRQVPVKKGSVRHGTPMDAKADVVRAEEPGDAMVLFVVGLFRMIEQISWARLPPRSGCRCCQCPLP